MTLTTVYHAYNYDIRKAADKSAYAELCTKLAAIKPRWMKALATFRESFCNVELDGQLLELETKHLFSNQWNTAPIPGISDKGLRVFDWAEDAIFGPSGQENKFIKRGHYLNQTEDMTTLRAVTKVCGYCGHQENAAFKNVFHLDCLGSGYLEEKDLKLTRLFYVNEHQRDYKDLTESELAELLPLYRDAQLHGRTDRDKARLAKQRQDLLDKHNKDTANTLAEYNGLTWLLDHGLKIDNVIYYSHRQRFGIGWRKPLSEAERSAWVKALSDFPYPYGFKEDK